VIRIGRDLVVTWIWILMYSGSGLNVDLDLNFVNLWEKDFCV